MHTANCLNISGLGNALGMHSPSIIYLAGDDRIGYGDDRIGYKRVENLLYIERPA